MKNQKVFIIAEAGVNHNGNLVIAKDMIDVACESGVDAIKFQTYLTEELIIDDIPKAGYQKKNMLFDKSTQTQMLKKLEINEAFHLELKSYCDLRGIYFLSTPYDIKSLNLLLRLNISKIKIASTDTTNLLFLEEVSKSKKPIILSTGMCSLGEIERAYDCLIQNKVKDITILKCTSEYPTDINNVNLNAIQTLKLAFPNATIGFSDHTEGLGASPYAVALGAKVIEKHFTLDKLMDGPDHKASLEPYELNQLVKEIRKIERMLGSSEIKPSKTEMMNKVSLQKNLVASQIIKKGEIISKEKLTAKRTGGKGISVSLTGEVINKKATIEIKKNEIIYWGALG